MRSASALLLALFVLAARAQGDPFLLEVRNGSALREDAVVTQTVTREWAAESASHALVESAGGREVPVPFGLDASGGEPVLFWLLPGRTEPGQVRRFAWVPRSVEPVSSGDLRVTAGPDAIAVENRFFRLKHPARGGGGFPADVFFAGSGRADPELYFLDRIVRPRESGGPLVQYCAKDCADAEARVVFQSPLRAVVEVRTGFGVRAAETPGRPQALYRYTYAAHSPVVEVSASLSREDDGPWKELHFLHLSRKERRYTHYVTGDPLKTHALRPKGERSQAVSGAQWAVMADGDDACGVGFDGAVCWDASNEFVYYLRSGHSVWEGPEHRFEGGLYFGPAGDAAWFSRWLGRERQPEVRVTRGGRAWAPVEREPARGAFAVENDALRVAFAGEAQGFDCLGIDNLLAGGARFVRGRARAAGLWSLTFQTAADAAGARESVTVDNRSPAVRKTARRVARGMVFEWQGLSLPGEPGAVDVRAEVRLEPGAGASAWRLAVTNRSARFGLWSSDFPLLRGVAPPGVADVLLPRGNWGGSLMPRHRGRFEGRYPSAGCPVQLLAFNLGEAGLYLAAHDGAARAKQVVVTAEQDATFRLLAENAGVPGAAGAPDYPVVVAATRGDWWEAARRYREWATQQPWAARGPIRLRGDYPARLAELGFWMILSGDPARVTNGMAQAAALFPGLPVGVHWYNWHQIPFDHSYPEYFPAKPGMAEASRAMAAAGQTVMPYINARLWDLDIPSFAGAYPAACKQASGTNYVETYGSGRSLVPMCPATPLWQAKVREICGRLIDECGVKAIYLDQIGAAAPAACFDPSHGHPLGGGRHWVDGYRALLRPVKRDAMRAGVALTTENTAEPYMDTVDAYLAWSPRDERDVPLLPAVYSGYTVYFTSPQAPQDSLDAFCAAQARDFLWGCQLGWNGEWILQEPHREKQRFQLALCRARQALLPFLAYGQLVDELRPLREIPGHAHVWNRNQPHLARLPDVMGAVWRDGQGRLAVIAVNASDREQAFECSVEPARWLGRGGPWQVTRVGPDGQEPVPVDAGGRALLGDLPARSVRTLLIAPRR